MPVIRSYLSLLILYKSQLLITLYFFIPRWEQKRMSVYLLYQLRFNQLIIVFYKSLYVTVKTKMSLVSIMRA